MTSLILPRQSWGKEEDHRIKTTMVMFSIAANQTTTVKIDILLASVAYSTRASTRFEMVPNTHVKVCVLNPSRCSCVIPQVLMDVHKNARPAILVKTAIMML